MKTAFVLTLALTLIGCVSTSTATRSNVAPSLASIPKSEGIVSINFDDGYESAYEKGLPIFDKVGIKTTLFIITRKLDDPNYMTIGQLKSAHIQGHEIAAHTKTHPHLSTLSQFDQADEIEGSVNDLRKLGIDPGSFAYPFGDFNGTTVNIVRGAGFIGARTIHKGMNDSSSDRLLLNCYVIDPDHTTDINQITQAIDDAQKKGTWLILLFHRVDETGNPISVRHELVQEVVDYLVSHKIATATMSEGLDRYNLKP